MTTLTQNYGSITVGDLSFQNINLSETDTIGGPGVIAAAFATSSGPVSPFSQNPPTEIGFGWGGLILDDGVVGPGGTVDQLLNFTYNISVTDPGELLSAVAPIYAVDIQSGSGRMVAIENVYDSSNNLLGTNVFDTNVSQSNSITALSHGVQTAHVQLTVELSASYSGTTAALGDQIGVSILAQDFLQTAGTISTPAIAIDKQISPDGGNTWFDVNNGVLNGPTVLAGSTLQERVIVTNTGSVTLNNVNVGDLGAGPSGFTFGGGNIASLAGGASATSDLGAYVDTGNLVHQFDTATATGTATTGGTVSATDTADYTPVKPSIALDKQISPDGGATWFDVTNGVLNGPTVLAGSTLKERVLVTNTGSVTLTNVNVSDLGAGPSGFTFTGGNIASLAAGATATSDLGSYVDVANPLVRQFDTATATGTASLYNNTGTVSATDTADYTPVKPSIALDKQISPDGGTTWFDVGSVLNGPTVLTGSTLKERVLVTNTGSVTLTNVNVADIGAGPSGFTFTGGNIASLAAGATATSDLGSYVDVANPLVHQFDTATATGTATLYGNNTTVTATDTADYTPVKPSIALDKQISPDGGATWFDVTNGVLNGPTVLAGSTLKERVLVTNTGSLTLTNVNVSDLGAGPSGFTFGGGNIAALAAGATATSDLGSYVDVANPLVHQSDTATATGTATLYGNSTTVTATDKADYTPVKPSIALDKQISPDGGNTWFDVNNGVLNGPTVLAGSTLKEQVIVTNTGSVTLTNVNVSDLGAGPSGFTFGGGNIASLAPGESAISDLGSYVDIANPLVQQFDTATATGTATLYNNSTTVTAQDKADYTPEKPAIALDKQISTDGTHWYDVGVGNLNNTPSLDDPQVTIGSPVYERVVVTNTGSVEIVQASVSDVGGNGPSGFTFAGGGGTFTLDPNGTITSDVATLAAASGYQLDTATVQGTGTDSWGNSANVTASDVANYTGINNQHSSTIDLTIAKTDFKLTVAAGAIDTYTITVTNNGPDSASNFFMTDAIPSQLLNPAFGAPSAGAYDPNTGLWSGVTLASGQSVSITLTGTIDPTAGGATTFTSSGTGGDGPENGSATVTVLNGEIIVILSSNIANPTAAGQEVSGIQFTLGSAPSSASLGSAAGKLIDIASGGVVSPDGGSITHWGVAQSGATLTLATAGTGAVGGKPIDLIIGSGPYNNANPSITGRNPQIQNTGTFVINAPGITAGTPVSGVAIEFGTGPDDVLSSTHQGNGGTITNTVTVSPAVGVTDSNPNNNTATDTDTITTTPTPAITIDKQISTDGVHWLDVGFNNTADAPTVLTGATLYERVSLTNIGSVTLTGVTVGDAGGFGAPSGFNFSSAQLPGGALAPGAIAVSNTQTIVTGGSGQQVDTATVTGTAVVGGNTVTVSGTDIAAYTPQLPPNQTDLSISKTDGKLSVVAGSVDTYTITVTNNGPGSVSGFTMTDAIPPQLLNPVFGAPSMGSYNSSTGVWSGLALGSGGSVTIPLTGTISPTAGGGSTTFTSIGSGGDGPENASASITVLNNEIIVVLSSNITNPTAAGQEVSGIKFTLGSAPGSASLSSALGPLINIASGGGVTSYSGGITHWGVAQSGATLTLATAGTGAVGGKPIDLIIGGGPYTHANPSITGRNPQIQGTGTFIISAPGITAGTPISSVSIEFGTGPDNLLAGQQGSGGGTITNTATVTPLAGITDTNPNNNTATDTDTVTPAPTPLCIVKTPSATALPGCQSVSYTYKVTNTGSVTLSNVQITDVTNGSTSATITDPNTLAAGATWTYTGASITPSVNSSTVYGTTNIATVNATAGGSPVTPASTEARVQVGGSPAPFGDHVQVGGSAPSGKLSTAFGGAAALEFSFNASGNTVATQFEGSGSTIATSSGSTPPSPAFIVVSNKVGDYDGSATNYFEGSVASGMKFYADFTVNPLTGVLTGTSFGANDLLYAHVFANQAAYQSGLPAVQEMKYSIGSAAINDSIGSLKEVGYVGTNGHGYAV